MTPTIQLLLIQIMQLGALLGATSPYQVCFDLHGPCSSVSVRIYAPGQVWGGEDAPKPIAQAHAYYSFPRWDWMPEEEQHEHIRRKLEFMRAVMHAYLPEAQEPQQEAA